MTEAQQHRVVRSLTQLVRMAEGIKHYYGGQPPGWPHKIAVAKKILEEVAPEFPNWEME
jgi:hypothetical protein